jgi:hypothetical protein
MLTAAPLNIRFGAVTAQVVTSAPIMRYLNRH